MSHFFTLVLIPGDTPLTEEALDVAVALRLAKYDENAEVEPYEEKCSCVGDKAYADAIAATEAKHPIAPLREAQRKEFPWNDEGKDPDEWLAASDAAWEARTAEREAFLRDLLASHPNKDTADPTCEECKGTGRVMSTYNPDSKWDWYEPGGRFNGRIHDAYDGSEDGFNFDSKYRLFTKNVRPVAELKEKMLGAPGQKVGFFALVTPDGQWHERATMGWSGMTRDRKDDFDDIARALLKQHADCLAVGLDLHI